MTVDEFRGGLDPYPQGVIIPWFESLDKIPDDWALCDGNNGTPNLLDKFVKSVPDTNTDPGATGGANSYSLSTSQMPSHSHSGSADSTGSHNHGFTEGFGNYQSTFTDNNQGVGGAETSVSSTNGSHSHSFNTGYTGNGSSIDNRPEHVEVAFIQKII